MRCFELALVDNGMVIRLIVFMIRWLRPLADTDLYFFFIPPTTTLGQFNLQFTVVADYYLVHTLDWYPTVIMQGRLLPVAIELSPAT